MLGVLRERFGMEAFRPPQDEIIASVLAGRDALVVMPTGGGKSLCYQLPALLLDGVTLVVSPLIALMKDQVDALRARGIEAAYVNSTQSWGEQVTVLDAVRRGEVRLLYISPERFRAASFLRALEGIRIGLFAVDEAHCLSQWGHDFRPDYLRLGSALNALGGPPCIALTATATVDVQADIAGSLGLRDPLVTVSGFARHNLAFVVRQVSRVSDKLDHIARLVADHGCGIVYAATRKSVEKISEALCHDRISHVVYHGGLTEAERTHAQESFMTGQVPVAVATNAFGMGIDRADIRFVCHYEMPGSVEAYYQEGGRAGRDGLPAVCELLFSYADKRVQEFFIEGANPGKPLVQEVFSVLKKKMGEAGEVHLSIDELADELNRKVNPMAVGTSLTLLARHGLVERFDVPGSRSRATRILKPEISPEAIALDERQLAQKAARDDKKLQDVIRFAYARTCRQKWILDYFGERNAPGCGRCDVCAARESVPASPLEEEEVVLVRKALSVVARMSVRHDRDTWEPRYGRTRIIECALGKHSLKRPVPALEKLSTWGILGEHPRRFVSGLYDALELGGLVEVGGSTYALFGLTPLGSRVMRGETAPSVDLSALKRTARRPSPKPARKGSAMDGDLSDEDAEIYKALAAKRLSLARARGNAPAYTILTNRALREIAIRKPRSVEEAAAINGIGPQKLKSVVPAFLKMLESFR
jgi:ATP-dependent DNA helicase RecQ